MSVPPSAHDELAAEYWSEFVRASWLRTCASIGASWLRTWASWLLLLPRIAYRRLNPPAESLLTSNVDVLEEVLSHCDAAALSAAMAVCRAWNERGAALLISDVWLARHMDLRTLLLMDAPRSAIAARVRAHPDDTDQLCRLVGDEAMENALDRVKQSKEGEQMFQTFFKHAPACWMPEVILREVAESLARKAWVMYPDGEPAEGEGHACRGCRVNQMVRKLPDGSEYFGSSSIWAPVDIKSHPFKILKAQFANPTTQAVGFYAFTTFDAEGVGSRMPCVMAVMWGRKGCESVGRHAQAIVIAMKPTPKVPAGMAYHVDMADMRKVAGVPSQIGRPDDFDAQGGDDGP